MAKVNAPLLSFGGSGTVAKTTVFSSWRGISYVRRWVTPSNPQSANQTKTRSVFSWLNAAWKSAPTLAQAPWTAFATGQKFVNRNAYIMKNLPALRPGTDLTGYVGSPGAKGGLGPLSIAPTAGAGTITVAFTNPAAPTGWTLTAAVATAIKNTDPHTTSNTVIVAAEDAVTFNSVVLTGLSAVEYQVSAWLVWTKPDGSTAYGASINTTATPT